MGSPQSTEYFKGYTPKLLLNDPLINQLAEKYNKNAGQVQVSEQMLHTVQACCVAVPFAIFFCSLCLAMFLLLL